MRPSNLVCNCTSTFVSHWFYLAPLQGKTQDMLERIGFLSPKLPSLQSCGAVIWQGTNLITVSTLKMGTTEDEMVGWHHQLSGDEFE